MFSGIIEARGKIVNIKKDGSNLQFFIESGISSELKIDQSVAHNGVCLTVEDIKKDFYQVTAIEETLKKTNLGKLQIGDSLNLERSLTLQTRIDGHMVQGHVDSTGLCISKEFKEGSWEFGFRYPAENFSLLVEKGSICVNGVSLTAFNCKEDHFNVAIIPYTFQHTTFEFLNAGDTVNLEFDILGKYIQRWMEGYRKTITPGI